MRVNLRVSISISLTLTIYIWQVCDTDGFTPIVLKTGKAGLLEIRYEDKWGIICLSTNNPAFDDNAAKVACQQMGYSSGKKASQATIVAPGGLPVVLKNAVCIGAEKSFKDCTLQKQSASDTCQVAVNVVCEDDPGLTGLLNIRFVQSTLTSEGILELSKNGKTDAVCYNAITAQSLSKVACRQMKFGGDLGTEPSSSKFTDVFEVDCDGKEVTLDACTVKHGTTCASGEVTYIRCTLDIASQRRFDIRLSPPSNSVSEGTVEVYQYGKWGVICDAGWDKEDAQVVCRELGFKGAKTKETGAKFGQGQTGVAFWEQVTCTGSEPSVDKCPKTVALGKNTCSSADAAGVVCINDELKYYDLCLEGNIDVAKGETLFLRSPKYPRDSNNYQDRTTCSCEVAGLASDVKFEAYVQNKMLQMNKVQALIFDDGNNVTTLYAEESSSQQFTFNTKTFTIQFQSNTSTAGGRFNIQLKASDAVSFTCNKTVITPTTIPPSTQAVTAASGKSTGPGVSNAVTPEPTDKPSVDLAGTIGGIVGAIIGIAITAVIIIILYKKKKCLFKPKQRRSSVSSFEKSLDGKPSGGGAVNPSYNPDEEGMKDNDIYDSAGPRSDVEAAKVGNGNVPRNNDVYAEVQPKSKRKEAKEPETGEAKNDVIRSRPASGSAVKVDIPNRAFNPDSKEEAPYDFEQAVPNSNAYEFEGPSRGGPYLAPINSTAYAEVEIQPKPASQAPEEPDKKGKNKKKEKEKKDKKGKKDKKKKTMGNADEPKETPSSVCPPSSKAPAVPKSDSTAVPKFDDANAVTYTEVGALGVGQPVGVPSQADSGQGEYDHLQFKRMNTPAQGGDDSTYDVVNR